MSPSEDLIAIANASGFLYQERVCHEVKSSSNTHCWRVVVTEHRWIDGGRERFIDAVVTKHNMRLVIEAKRNKGEANWIFLPYPGTSWQDDRVHRLWTRVEGDGTRTLQWDEGVSVRPYSASARFCMVKGSGDDDSPMLERTAGVLLRSTEAIANEELAVSSRAQSPLVRWFYFPVVVTNARLHVCNFNPARVDLDTGNLPLDTEVKEVGFVRFTKSLSTGVSNGRQPVTLDASNLASERTIFVVNGSKLTEFLEHFEMR